MQSLHSHYDATLKAQSLHSLLNDQARVDKVQFMDANRQVMLDASHSKVDQECLSKWQALLEEKNVAQKKESMFNGQVMNSTENRAVLHTALRGKKDSPVLVDGQDVMPGIHQVLDEIEAFSS